MVADVADILLDDTDTVPDPRGMGDADSAPKATGPTGGRRGRPRGSGGGKRSGIAGMAGATSSAPSGAGRTVSGARELAALIAQLIGGLSIALALFLDTDELAMSSEEARAIARPAARLMLRSGFASQALVLANRGGDWGALAWAALMYGIRVYPVIVQRQQALDLQRQQLAAQQRGNTQHAQRGATSGADVVLRQQAQQTGSGTVGTTGNAGSGNAPTGADPFSADAVASALAVASGAGFADPDALARGTYANVGAISREYPVN